MEHPEVRKRFSPYRRDDLPLFTRFLLAYCIDVNTYKLLDSADIIDITLQYHSYASHLYNVRPGDSRQGKDLMERTEALVQKRQAFPVRLKQERDRHGWSQSDLASRLGTSQVNVSRWEKGLTTPGPYFRQRLAEVFGKSLEELGFIIDEQEQKGSDTVAISAGMPTRATPLNMLPYRRNAFFTGREDVLTRLFTTLTSRRSVALTQAQAISGLGGIGKTQIAVEYAYRYAEHYQAILWVTASTRETFIADIVLLADLLDLPEKGEQDQHIVIRAVKLWLATTSLRWLLILDNVDDLELIADFLPSQGYGDALITTRLQALGSLARAIEVEKMGRDEGVMFLLRRTQTLAAGAPLSQVEQGHRALAGAIVGELDGLPLALDQAGAYIEETRCGFAGYQQLYQTRRKELLRRRGRFPVDHPESAATTWSLSFQQVERESPAAADLLRILTFLYPEAIPEEILSKGAAEFGPPLCQVAADPLALNEAIELLLRYSLLRRHPAVGSLQMHRLVQAVLKDSMEDGQQQVWAERALRATNRAFPDVDLSTWPQCQRVLPHAQVGALTQAEYDLAFPEAARLFNQAANYLAVHARYSEAEPLLLSARAILEQVFDTNHPALAATLNDLGALYLTQGHYQQAAPLLQRARAIREQALGAEHAATAASLFHLAALYYAQGNYRQAERLSQQALAIRQQTLTTEDTAIAQSLSQLAELYTVQGKYEGAERLYLQAQRSQEQTLGERHPDVARTLNNLALLYRAQGQYEQAAQTFQRALNIQGQIWGRHHPDMAYTLNNLARLYRAQGKYTEAEPFYLRALSVSQEIFGSEHPQVAQCLYGLAKLYNSQGKYTEAQQLTQQALTMREKLLGRDHPDVAYTLGLLAKIAEAQQDFEAAEACNLRALQIREKTSDAQHPHIAHLSNNLAELYHAQGRHREAEPYVLRALAIYQAVLGSDHPYLAFSLTNRAENLLLQGHYEQAEPFLQEAIAIRQKNLGLEHPRTAAAYHNLARLYHVQGRYEEAEGCYRRALAIREAALGIEHPIVQAGLKDYLSLLHAMGCETQARELETRMRADKPAR